MSEMNSAITATGEIDIVTEMEKDVEELHTRHVINHILSNFSDKYPETKLTSFNIEHTGSGGKYEYEISAKDNKNLSES